jgi:hypothetical protein
MKTKNTKYGGVTFNKQQNIYYCYFWNPFTQEKENVKYFKEKNEADNYINELNFNFFSKNTQFLPKGISINRRDKAFMFTLIIKNRNIHIFQSKDLDEVVDFKFEFIKKFFN